MTTKCAACGKFVPYSQMEPGGGARFEFTPDSDRSSEQSDWVCAACVREETERKAS